MAKKLHRATMVDLSDELVLEIIARLPLKYAIQCSVLNKNFCHRISQPIFQRRLLPSSPRSNTSIFYLNGNTLTRINAEGGRISEVSTAIRISHSIEASCNVLLLVSLFILSQSFYVFNPLTGGIMFVDYPLSYFRFNIGLAVDQLDARNFHIKLVVADMNFTDDDSTIERFSVVSPPSAAAGSPSWSVKSQVEFVGGSLIPICRFGQPVYVHGCMHWLGKQGNKIVVFNIEKEKARIISGPVDNNEPGFLSQIKKCSWFGFADGSLHFIYTLPEKIVIHSHDYLKDEWQVKHKIAKICDPTKDDVLIGKGLLSGFISLFFDGRSLFVKSQERVDVDGVVLMYDASRDKWVKTGKIEGGPHPGQRFFTFFPTLAKV